MESKFTAEFCRGLRQCNAMVYPLIGSTRAPAGWPDRYVHHRLWQGFIEFKATETVVRTHQWEIIRNLNKIKPLSALILRESLERPGTGVMEFPEEFCPSWLEISRESLAPNGLLRELSRLAGLQKNWE